MDRLIRNADKCNLGSVMAYYIQTDLPGRKVDVSPYPVSQKFEAREPLYLADNQFKGWIFQNPV